MTLDAERCGYCGGPGPEIEPFGSCVLCTQRMAHDWKVEAEAWLEALGGLVEKALEAGIQQVDVRAAVAGALGEHEDKPNMTLAGLAELVGRPRDGEIGEALALLHEIAVDRVEACCSDIRPDISERLDAWVARRRAEVSGAVVGGAGPC